MPEPLHISLACLGNVVAMFGAAAAAGLRRLVGLVLDVDSCSEKLEFHRQF